MSSNGKRYISRRNRIEQREKAIRLLVPILILSIIFRLESAQTSEQEGINLLTGKQGEFDMIRYFMLEIKL